MQMLRLVTYYSKTIAITFYKQAESYFPNRKKVLDT